MPRHLFFLLVICFATVGCSPADLDRVRADQAKAERVYIATTQATAAARLALASASPTMQATPAYADAQKVIAAADKAQQAARIGLDLAAATLNAATNQDPTNPAFVAAVSGALAAVPSPWTAMLAALLPAVIPLTISISQAFKLGHTRSTVERVTLQLQEHKAAIEKLEAGKE